MKHGDSLLLAWKTTISRKGDDAAIFDTAGKIVQRFEEVEERAILKPSGHAASAVARAVIAKP